MRTGAIAVRTWLGLVICLGVHAWGANEPNEREIQLAQSKMEELKAAHQKYRQAVVGLLSAYEEAARANPDFGPGVTGLLRIKMLSRFPGAKESAKYQDEDPEGWQKLLLMSEGASMAKVMGDHLRDPNLAKQLRPGLLFLYRAGKGWIPEQREKFMKELEDRGHTVFDPNDRDDERLWQNIKKYELEQAEGAIRMQKQLLQEQHVPQWMLNWAGYYRFADSMGEWLDFWLSMEMPDQVLDASRQVRTVMENLDRIYPSWKRIQYLLGADASPEYGSAVNRAARWSDDIIASINRVYPSSNQIGPGPSDASFDERKAGYMVYELMRIFEEAARHRPSAEVRNQYHERRFVVRPEGRSE